MTTPSKAPRMFLEQNNLCNWFHSAIASNYLLTSQEIQIFPPMGHHTQSQDLCKFGFFDWISDVCMYEDNLLVLLINFYGFLLFKKKISKCRVSFSFCLQFHRLFMKQRNSLSMACKVEFIYKSEVPGALVFCHRHLSGREILLTAIIFHWAKAYFLFVLVCELHCS